MTVAVSTGVRDKTAIPAPVTAADTAALQDALDRYGLMAVDTDVRVEASDGTVTLTGHVHSWAERDTLIAAAWRGVGVKKVCGYVVVMG